MRVASPKESVFRASPEGQAIVERDRRIAYCADGARRVRLAGFRISNEGKQQLERHGRVTRR
jgi:hypothetical protein